MKKGESKKKGKQKQQEPNPYLDKNIGGRPALYDSPEEMEQRIAEYFDTPNCDYTVSGLALFLGFESKQSLYDYSKRERFSYPIKRARTIIENAYEKKLSHYNPTGAIFALKNMGWTDKTEIDHTTGGEKVGAFTWELVLPAGYSGERGLPAGDGDKT